MAGMTALQNFVVQLEKVAPKIANSTEQTSRLSRILGTGMAEAEPVSEHAFRVILQTDNPARVAFNLIDGGALPGGVGSKWNQFTMLPATYVLPVQFTHLAQRLATPKSVSVIDPVAKTIADVVKQAAKVRDLFLQTPGDGSLGTVNSVQGNTIILNSTTTAVIDGRGAHLLDRQQTVQVQSNAYVPRGTCTIQDKFGFLGGQQSILVDQVPGGTGAGDLIIAEGLPGGAPQGINGLPVFINTSTAGTLLGLPRALSYVVANGVNCGSAQISVPILMLAENQVLQRLGDEALDGLFWHWHMAQTQAYSELGWQLQFIPLDGGKAGGLDLLFKKDGMTINGRRIYENLHADETRGDLVNKNTWTMAKWGAETPYWLKKRSGDPVFTQYDPASGNPTTNELMYQQEAYQWGNGNPSAQGGFFAAKAPTGN